MRLLWSLILSGICIAHGLTPTSYFSAEDRTRIKKLFESTVEAARRDATSMQELHFATRGLKVLGTDLKIIN